MSNRDGIAAKLQSSRKVIRFVQEVHSGSSCISNISNNNNNNDRWLHFGLGSSGAVDRIEIRWPNGNSESFLGGSADRFCHFN